MISGFCILMDAFFVVLMTWCAVIDIKTRTVSNISVALLLCLGVMHMALMLGACSTWWIYPAGLLLAAPFFIAWLKGGMGAGDVKLLMDIGLYLGLVNTLTAFVLMLPLLIVCTIVYRRKGKTAKSAIPLAPVLASGAVGTVLLGYIVTSL